ncbi:hypothetical protein ACJJH9_07305 [Microbulbifer sp. DLAB2-AF]|uniref:hypothetical protein n=1 Tax=Microbulbifer sp. DLAB2-AF TaxID=3243395 RepID=UPI0040396D2B
MLRPFLLALIFLSFVFPVLAEEKPSGQLDSWRLVSFKNEPLLNLHLYLYELARDKNLYVALKKEEGIVADQLYLFERAINDYITHGAEKNINIIRSSGEVADLTAMLLSGTPIDSESVNNSLYAHLQELSTLYNEKMWGLHRESNFRWYLSLREKLDVYGDPIASRLEDLFGEKLLVNAHTVNIVYKPGMRQGATTSGRSSQTIINSTYSDYSGWLALEMFFHELTHANSVNRKSKLQGIISSEFDKYHLKAHKHIWHPIQFYTVGEVVRRVISEEEPNFTDYATLNGLYVGRWNYKSLLDKHWMPYLNGLVSMEEAVADLAKNLSNEKREN